MSLQLPIPSQVGVTSLSTGQEVGPHTVPAGCEPVTTQVAVPVSHETVPVSQGLGTVHVPPAVHEPHVPPWHTLFEPQEVPFGTSPDSVQTEVPVAHEVRPVLHGFVGWQVAPAVHEEQVPLSQTLFVPHEVPLATLPVSTQTEVPVAQAVVPFLQGLAGWQVTPVVQALHVPLLQTLFVPHDTPLATFPVSAQTEVPVTHDVAPVLHGLAGWQLAPAVHDTQVPLPQTLLVPHVVPFARFWPVSVQVIVGEQEVMPA